MGDGGLSLTYVGRNAETLNETVIKLEAKGREFSPINYEIKILKLFVENQMFP